MVRGRLQNVRPENVQVGDFIVVHRKVDDVYFSARGRVHSIERLSNGAWKYLSHKGKTIEAVSYHDDCKIVLIEAAPVQTESLLGEWEAS